MTIDFKDDIVDQDDYLKFFDYGERMEKLYPLMKEAKEGRKRMQTSFKINGRTIEFIVDKDGTGVLRKKPMTGWF
ncbi:MAG: hypothetical protein HY341_00065 [Candidatus Kerfeldbacteria bacterium]|nr:hypothetical protein [Candidatus Kerfeldbacteria bacterium]